MKNKKYKWLLTACMFTLASGCSNDNAADKQESNEMEQMTNNPRQVSQRYNDRYPDHTVDQSMNNNRSTAVVSQDIGEDIENVKYVVRMTTPYEAKQVWVNGETITVKVDSRGKIDSKEEWKKEKIRIHNLLRNTIPGYDFNIQLDK